MGFVTLDKLAVEPQRGATCGESQHKGLGIFEEFFRLGILVVTLDRGYNHIGHILHTLCLLFKHRSANLFVATDDVARCRA